MNNNNIRQDKKLEVVYAVQELEQKLKTYLYSIAYDECREVTAVDIRNFFAELQESKRRKL